MGLYDDLLEEEQIQPVQTKKNTNVNNQSSGLFDDLLVEEPEPQKQTFREAHPFVSSLPEAGKQLTLRAAKSYPEFGKGLNDLVALVGDKTHIKGLSDFGRSNAEFWQDAADKIVIDDKYRGLNGLKSKETVIPTIMGEIGGQATNLLMAAGGGAGTGMAAKAAGLGKVGTGIATVAGTAVPNLAQEGQYLEKIEAFQNIYGRMPTPEELKYIQNVALGEKAVNTALETVSDRLLFGKLFPQGTATKGVKGILKNVGEQAITEAGTEGMQESVSIGAEKMLGLNNASFKENLGRVGEASAMGGITGGAIGGGATVISQPYDSQITNAPVQALQNVSAKIVDSGKVLYDSAVDKANSVANSVADMANSLNAPDAFDTLTQLRNDGYLSPSKVAAEEIAPNIANKKAIKEANKKAKSEKTINNSDSSSVQDTGLPNLLKENETLQNLTQDGESQIVDNETVEKTAKKIKATEKKSAANQAVLEKPQTKAERKEVAKKQAIEKIKELAPNIAAKKEEQTNAQKSANLAKLQREVGIGGLIKDNEGNVYEVVGNGYIRNVDTNEHSAGSVDREYQKYEHNKNELISAKPFEYNPKSKDNADNYTFSKQEAVDAYNNYIKNPTQANQEIYEDTIGKLQNEYYKLEPQFKAEAETKSKKVSDSVKEIAPNIAAKVEAKRQSKIVKSRGVVTGLDENGNTAKYEYGTDKDGHFTTEKIGETAKQKDAAVNSAVKNETIDDKNTEIEKVAQQYADMLGHGEAREFHRNFAKALANKDAASLKTLIAHGRGFNENAKKMFTKYTGIKLPTTIKGKIETLEKWANGEVVKEEEKTFNNNNKTITFKDKELKTQNGEQAIHASDKYVTDGHIVFARDYFNFGNKDSDFKFIEYKEDMPYNKEFDRKLSEFINYEHNNKLLENPQLTKHKNKPCVLFKNGNSDIFLDKKYYDMIKDFDLYAKENEALNAIVIRNKAGENIGVVMPLLIPSGDIQTAKNIAKTIRYKKNNDVYSSGKISKGETNNGNELAGNGVSEKLAENGTQNETSTATETEQTNERNSNKDRRGDELSSEQRGISQKHAELINKEYKNQHELNLAIEKFINDGEYKIYSPGSRFPEAIKNWLKKYAGAGGLEKQGAEGKGLLSEYYTPQNIVDKMWELTAQYVDIKGAKVLEPSVGIGRFLENAEEYAKGFDVVEMNPVSARITKILYPNANVTTGEFQERFINKSNNTPVKNVTPEYDVVIGNPPYGAYSGRYKGLGEGKKFSRIEAYFINRGLDTLKENGIMTFIVPSSFLDGAITPGKQEIGKKCELLDAYRLPENTFDTTSIGTDIIVLRKTNGETIEQNINLGKWFKNNPNKILGTEETRKNRFGKEETYIKGDKNAVDTISAANKNIKQTIEASKKEEIKPQAEKDQNVDVNKKVKKAVPKTVKGKIEYTEYVPENKASDREIELWEHTAVDGTIQGGGYTMENGKQVRNYRPGEDINQYKGELYNDFNYLQGDIYEKLDRLEYEDISEKQKEIQRKKLKSVLPEPKGVVDIAFNPTSDFIREFETGIVEENERWDYSTRTTRKVFENKSLDELYLKYVDKLSRSERGDMTTSHIYDFVKGNKIRIDYRYPSGCYGDKERAEFRKQKSAEILSKLKNVVDKTFNDFVRNELTREQQEKLAREWNRRFNAVYNPDYAKMPMIVKGLNSEFYGKKLELQNVQIEGVNFLTNKGVGLLGFEVGVGKTLTGIISTVQNMQMGRCKKPLILVPKQVKDNWIREINQAFPNIEVNDVDNMSKFKGEIPENTLTVATYEALGNIWYEDSIEALTNQIYSVQNNFSRESTKRGQEVTKETAEKMLGEAEKGNKKLFTIQELGFDHITVDEAHNFKNLFDKAKAAGQDGNTYANITGGSQSTRAARLFLMAQYILNNNHNRNVFMLTATPFNNSPIEVFNMVSFIGKDKLDRMGLYNVYQFMENYADISSDWIVNSKNEVEYKQVVTGFKNASSLRELIKSVMLIRSAEDAGIVRPEKHTKRVVLEPSEAQIELIKQAEEEATTGKKDDGAILKAINQSRQATLSPDIATGNFDVTPEDFVKNSPKIHYVMEAVEAMKKKDSSTSQIIYMPLGVKFLPKMKEYLVNKGTYKADEIAIIDSGVADDKISKITDSFNDRNGKVKLVIGTNKIKEGMNLNKNSSVLYVPYMDWNPTDFVQVVGRIWRRGNRYSKIRVVVPLLKNSSDSFMFQKLNEKTDRINNIMDENKEYIDTSELNTAEEKINMISNPDKKARMFIRVEEQKLQAQKSSLEGRLEMVQSYKGQLNSDKNSVEYYEKNIKDTQQEIDELEEKSGWRYDMLQGRLDNYKKELSGAKAALKRIKTRIEKLELDFEGKDSTEIIEAEIAKVQQQIEDVKNLGEKKLVEYQAAYEEERKNKKSIEQLISEFNNDTDSLYGDSKVEESRAILEAEPKKRYEKTSENSYNIPKIELETSSQKSRKKKSKSMTEKAKEVIDAKQYNKELKKGVAKWHAEINERRYDADRTLNSFINHTRNIAKELGVKDKHLREVMPFLRERTDFPESLNRPELKKVWDKIQATKGASERITKLADNLAKKFDRFYREYKAVQADGDFETNENNIENYVPHDWQVSNKKQKSLLTSHFATKSRFAKQRTIDTWYKGIEGIEAENGEIVKFTPKTLDYAELFKIQSDNLIKATVDKVFADSVKTYKADNGASLVMPANKAPSDWVEINNSALNKAVARPVHTEYGEKVSPELQNKLAEIGVAIGNRLPKYKANGTPNSLGKFIKNTPPEIRLQRWFSLKTLAHEVGHFCDMTLGLTKEGFVNRHRDELTELNRERIEAFSKQGDKAYAEKDSELIAELFGVMFNDVEFALKVAPGATSEILGRMTENKKLETILPANLDWGNAKHILEEKVVEIFKMPVKVHPDIAATLKTVFENKREYLDIMGFKPGEALDKTNAVAKQFNFSLSGFHGWALSESFFGNVGVIEGAKQALDFKKIYESVKNNDYDIYKKDVVVKQAIKDGLQIGATLDTQRDVAEGLINSTGKYLENKIPGMGKIFSAPVNAVAKTTELNNKVLWDCLHNNYKIGAYEILVSNEINKNGNISEAQRQEIAQWVNDSFGGQVWENLGINPTTKKAASRWLMSPDWLLSTTRQFMGMFSSETLHKALNAKAKDSDIWQKVKDTTTLLGINSITDDVTASGTRGRIARAFWVRSAIMSVIYMNVLNAVCRAWDRDKNKELYPKNMKPVDYTMFANSVGSKQYIFIGRNSDGTERYLRLGKQFREVPEMLADPIKHIGAKTAPIPQSIVTGFTGRSMGGYENKEISKAQGWARIGLAAKNLGKTYLPFSVSSALVKKGDYSLADLIGNTSKGMTKYKAKEEYTKAWNRAKLPQNITDTLRINEEEITRSMRMNRISEKDINSTRKSARTAFTKPYKEEYKEALGSGDSNKIIKITEKMQQNKISSVEQQKIYLKALSEFYKERGFAQ